MTRTTHARPSTTARTIVVAALSVPMALSVVGTAAAADADPAVTSTTSASDDGKTCDQLGYTKVDKESGVVTDDFGTLTWGGRTLTYALKPGYTIELCVKGGAVTPIIELGTTSGTGSYTHPQGISHIGYQAAVFTPVVTTTTEPTPTPTVTPTEPTPTGTPTPTPTQTDGPTGTPTPTPTQTDGPTGTPTPTPTTPVGTPGAPGSPSTPGTPIGGADGGAGSGGGTPSDGTPTPSASAVPISGQPAPAAGAGGSTTGTGTPRTVTPARGAQASPAALPFTGSTTSLLLALGTGLVLAGGGLALSGRRATAAPDA